MAHLRLGLLRARFIPACAGNSGGEGPACQPAPVHPRVCGEQRHEDAHGDDLTGSSPRVRGTAPRSPRTWRWCRFIPACAGNSTRSADRHRRSPVQPRVCGEQDLPHLAVVLLAGSSPRVRGTERYALGLGDVALGRVRRLSPRAGRDGLRRPAGRPHGRAPWFEGSVGRFCATHVGGAEGLIAR